MVIIWFLPDNKSSSSLPSVSFCRACWLLHEIVFKPPLSIPQDLSTLQADNILPLVLCVFFCFSHKLKFMPLPPQFAHQEEWCTAPKYLDDLILIRDSLLLPVRPHSVWLGDCWMMFLRILMDAIMSSGLLCLLFVILAAFTYVFNLLPALMSFPSSCGYKP